MLAQNEVDLVLAFADEREWAILGNNKSAINLVTEWLEKPILISVSSLELEQGPPCPYGLGWCVSVRFIMAPPPKSESDLSDALVRLLKELVVEIEGEAS